MIRIMLSVVVLTATSIAQQQKAPQVSGNPDNRDPGVISVDPSEVTPVPPAAFKLDGKLPRSSEKLTTQKPRPKVPTLDLRPAAACEREMNDALDTDRNYIALMEQPELQRLYKRALDCLPLQQSTRALRRTALVLGETRYRLGFSIGCKSGTSRATDLGQAAIDKIRNANETERESAIHDYDALVDRYNSLAEDYNNHDAALVNRYNSLVNDYNRLLGLAQQLVDLPSTRSSLALMPAAPPPPREVYLTCTASSLPGNMATVSCW